MLIVKNRMEDVVNYLISSILNNYGEEVCQCDRCIADIKAIALNNLEPKYYATETGEVFYKVKEMSIQFETDVTKAIILAMDRVKKYPRHKQ